MASKTERRTPNNYAYGLLNVSHEVIGQGVEIARHYRETSITSITPRTIAASALYLACRENGHDFTQREIAHTFGLAEYTVREISGRINKSLRGG